MFQAILPHQIFFYPTQTFMQVMDEMYSDVGILEAGSGCGHVIKTVRDYGIANGVNAMMNIRGFDMNKRTDYEVSEYEIFHQDALECNFYHKNLQVLVCRPNHGGWVELLLEEFLTGQKTCKRFIYCGLESNLDKDFSKDQLDRVLHKHTGVGEEGEVMLVWEFNNEI